MEDLPMEIPETSLASYVLVGDLETIRQAIWRCAVFYYVRPGIDIILKKEGNLVVYVKTTGR